MGIHSKRNTDPPTYKDNHKEQRQRHTHYVHIFTEESRSPHYMTTTQKTYVDAHTYSTGKPRTLIHTNSHTLTYSVPTLWSVRVKCSLRRCPQFVSINLTAARRGLVRRSTSLCNLLLMCCTLSLSEPIWSDCEQTEIPPMLSEQVLLMGLSIRPSPITACLQSPLNTLHQRSLDFRS